MQADVLIVGQGLAGTLLAWELERAGISFAIADRGHGTAASAMAGGIINPITGRRLVKSWRVDRLLPAARIAYHAMESALGVPLWRDVRVWRRFADDGERRAFARKQARGDLAPFAGEAEAAGFWIEGAARVDLQLLLTAARARWRRQGRLQERDSAPGEEAAHHDLVVDCSGAAGALGPVFRYLPWEFAKGQMLEVTVEGLRPEVVLNCRHWVLPIGPRTAWVGATHEPGANDIQPTPAARAALEASARALLDCSFTVMAQRAGVRVNLPDKRPVAGRHPRQPGLGVSNGLGGKGALLAPMLARQWVNHLTAGASFDAEIDVRRFG